MSYMDGEVENNRPANISKPDLAELGDLRK